MFVTVQSREALPKRVLFLDPKSKFCFQAQLLNVENLIKSPKHMHTAPPKSRLHDYIWHV